MAARLLRCWLAVLAAACATPRPMASIEGELALAARALRDGRIDEAAERVAEVRRRAPRSIAGAQWHATIASLGWRDDEAVEACRTALRSARDADAPRELVAELEGRLGDVLFQAGRYGESVQPLSRGAVGEAAARRRALAVLAGGLPFVREAAGPVASEQRVVVGDVPEFACGIGGRQRPFAIDTGTSMTCVTRSFADDLGVAPRWPAGSAFDGLGRSVAAEVGIIARFTAGDLTLGDVPATVVDDAAMQLRDAYGGLQRAPRGVLGLDVLGSLRLTLDPERGSVLLERPRGLPEAQSVPCVRVEGRCLVPVVIDDVRLWFVLDTGASDSSFTEAGLERLPGGVGRASPAFRRVRTLGGAAVAVREVRDVTLRCSEARFVGATFAVVDRERSTLFPVHGVLGVDLLCRCRMILDRGRVRIVALG